MASSPTGLSLRCLSTSTVSLASQKAFPGKLKRPETRSMMPARVAVVGGTGFIGKRLVYRLYELGYNVKVISRRPENIKKKFAAENITVKDGFRPASARTKVQRDSHDVLKAGILAVEDVSAEILGMSTTIYLELYRSSVRQASIASAFEDCDSVVNLVGILYEGKLNGTFDATHAEGAARIAASASQFNIKRLIHISAIGASEESASEYARSKAAGEKAVRHYCPTATILRPSIVVGPGDGFFSFFDRMAAFSPFLPLVGGGKAKFQPVHVDDLVEAIAFALVNEQAQGQTYEVGGPQVFTFEELLRKLIAYRRRWRFCPRLSLKLANLFAAVSEMLPFAPLLTRDQVKQLQRDNVVSPGAQTLEDLGVGDLLTVDEALKDTFEG